MPPRRSINPRKTRTREHVIHDLGINHFERQALLCGFSLQRIQHDDGLDLWLNTYTPAGEVENGFLWIQVKATDRIKRVARGREIAVRLDRRDVRSWAREELPVILVLYDALADVAYWLHVQAYVAARTLKLGRARGGTVTVRLPITNLVDQAAIHCFAAWKNELQERILRVIYADD